MFLFKDEEEQNKASDENGDVGEESFYSPTFLKCTNFFLF